jgi:hypothetical protein
MHGCNSKPIMNRPFGILSLAKSRYHGIQQVQVRLHLPFHENAAKGFHCLKLPYLCRKTNLAEHYKYRAFGLKIASELMLPELPEDAFPEPDVSIHWGENPAELSGIKGSGVLYQAKMNDFLFRLETVGSYRVQDGNKITVQRLNDSTDDEVRLFLLGSAFGAMLMQRDLLPFHGSTVVKDDKAYVIGGISGAGKSSLAATLVKRGYRLLADDISVILMDNGHPLVLPGIPHLKLWKDVLKKLEEDVSQYMKVRPQLLKYRKPARTDYFASPVSLASISLLATKNTPGFETEAIKGAEKFTILKNNTYRYQYIDGLDKTMPHFQIATALASQSKIYRIRRPTSPLLLEELADYFEKTIITG